MATVQSQSLVVRWMLMQHLHKALRIEEESYLWPWSYLELKENYLAEHTVGMVVEQGNDVLGFAFCEFLNTSIDIVNLAVAPEARRLGIGSLLLNRIKYYLMGGSRIRLMADVWEYNVVGQLFFRKNGFKCRCIVKDAYDVDGIYESGDAYHMTYIHGHRSKKGRR